MINPRSTETKEEATKTESLPKYSQFSSPSSNKDLTPAAPARPSKVHMIAVSNGAMANTANIKMALVSQPSLTFPPEITPADAQKIQQQSRNQSDSVAPLLNGISELTMQGLASGANVNDLKLQANVIDGGNITIPSRATSSSNLQNEEEKRPAISMGGK